MHSRIFQISKEPIRPENYIKGCHEWFVNSIADYAVVSDSREFDIRKLAQVSGINVHNSDEYFIVDSGKYFEKKFQEFENHIEEVKQLTNIGSFIGDGNNPYALGYCLSVLMGDYDDKYGYYVSLSDDSNCLLTLDYFVRFVAEAGCKYYIGGVLDYHF